MHHNYNKLIKIQEGAIYFNAIHYYTMMINPVPLGNLKHIQNDLDHIQRSRRESAEKEVNTLKILMGDNYKKSGTPVNFKNWLTQLEKDLEYWEKEYNIYSEVNSAASYRVEKQEKEMDKIKAKIRYINNNELTEYNYISVVNDGKIFAYILSNNSINSMNNELKSSIIKEDEQIYPEFVELINIDDLYKENSLYSDYEIKLLTDTTNNTTITRSNIHNRLADFEKLVSYLRNQYNEIIKTTKVSGCDGSDCLRIRDKEKTLQLLKRKIKSNETFLKNGQYRTRVKNGAIWVINYSNNNNSNSSYSNKQNGGNDKKITKSAEKVNVRNKTQNVYLGPRGGRYVKINNKLVPCSKMNL